MCTEGDGVVGTTLTLELDNFADAGFCTGCDFWNGSYALPHFAACSWRLVVVDFQTVTIVAGITTSGADYILEVTVFGSGACGFNPVFRRNLGTTMPTCLSGLTGNVPLDSSSATPCDTTAATCDVISVA